MIARAKRLHRPGAGKNRRCIPAEVSDVISGRDSGFTDFESSDAISLNTLDVSIPY